MSAPLRKIPQMFILGITSVFLLNGCTKCSRDYPDSPPSNLDSDAVEEPMGSDSEVAPEPDSMPSPPDESDISPSDPHETIDQPESSPPEPEASSPGTPPPSYDGGGESYESPPPSYDESEASPDYGAEEASEPEYYEEVEE